MDYKTFSAAADPAANAEPSAGWLPEAEIRLAIKDREFDKAWIDLQLLCISILEHWHKQTPNTQNPSTAYFIMPSDPYETAIRPFEELDDGANPQAYPSALQCAQAIVENIEQGIFWPPRPFRGNWDDPYAPLFVNGTPEASSITPKPLGDFKEPHNETVGKYLQRNAPSQRGQREDLRPHHAHHSASTSRSGSRTRVPPSPLPENLPANSSINYSNALPRQPKTRRNWQLSLETPE